MVASTPGRWTLVTIVALLLATPIATAYGHPDDARRPEDATEGEWALTSTFHSPELFTYSMQRSGEQPAQIHAHYDLEPANLNLTYREPPATGPDDEDGRYVNLTVQVVGLYEYEDVDNDGRLDLGDPIHRFDRLSQSSSARLDRLDVEGPAQGVQATYKLERSGTVEIDVVAAPGTELPDTTVLSPTDTQLNVTLHGLEPADEQTRFALAMKVSGESVEQEDVRMVAAEGRGVDGLFSWRSVTIVDHTRMNTASRVIERLLGDQAAHPEEGLVLLSTPPGSQLQYETQVSIAYPTSGVQTVIQQIKGDPIVFSLGLAFAGALVVTTAVAKLRQRESGTTGES